MKKLFLIVILFLAGAPMFAQTHSGSISVKIADAAGNPLPYASVVVKKSADSSLLKGQMSDNDGKCFFEKIPAGAYYLEVSQLGFTAKKSEVFHVDAAHQQIDLKTLSLAAAPKNLQTVNVTGQKPFIERSEGKTILNVESSAVAAGNTAMDVLRRAPGVTVDKDDNLQLRGKQGVTIMLDGKLTYLTNEALADLLKSMPAESISQIEIITSPSAKYDAAGSSGIINIKTKKGQLTGLNGTVNASFGGGRYLFYNTGLSLNWRTKKLNVFGNINWGDRQFFNTRELYRFTGGSIPMQFRQDVFQKGEFLNRSLKAGIDYTITDKQTIGVMVNAYRNAFWRDAPSATQIANKGGNTDSTLYTGVWGNNRFKNTSYNLNYKLKLDTSGSEFTIDADYADFGNNMKTLLADSTVSSHTGAVTQRSSINTTPYTDITIKSIKADFVKVLNKTNKVEAGVKASFVDTENFMQYDSLLNGVFVPVPSQYDQFVYKEKILAGYLIYKKQLKKTDFVLGLRLEQTTADGNSVSLKTRTERTYLDFFPNASIDHKFNDNNKLSLAYSKRINRPGYGQLNPFMFFLDRYTFFRGNSYLTPEYTHNTELSWMFKQKYIAAVSYSRTNDIWDEWLIVDDETRITISTNKNLGTQNNYSLDLTLPFDFTKWWNSTNNLSFFYNKYKINDPDPKKNFSTQQLSYNFNTTNIFTLPKGIKFELGAWYNAPTVYGIFKSKAQGAVNMGVQKDIFQKKGSLKINVGDVFASNRFRGTAEYNNVYLKVNNRWQNRTLNVAFSYRFGNTKVEAARERQTGTADELRRAGN